jgi:hypothetical protein
MVPTNLRLFRSRLLLLTATEYGFLKCGSQPTVVGVGASSQQLPKTYYCNRPIHTSGRPLSFNVRAFVNCSCSWKNILHVLCDGTGTFNSSLYV